MRLQDNHQFKLKPLGPNHREILLAMDNSDGQIPFVTQEKEGKFTMPVELLWQNGLSLMNIFNCPRNPWYAATTYCHFLFSNQTLRQEVPSSVFMEAVYFAVTVFCKGKKPHSIKRIIKVYKGAR